MARKNKKRVYKTLSKRQERRRLSAERRHKRNLQDKGLPAIKEMLKAGLTQHEIRRLVDEYQDMAPWEQSEYEPDNATMWAMMKEYHDLVEMGAIEPELSEVEVYRNIGYIMPNLLNEDSLEQVLKKGRIKAAQIREKEKKDEKKAQSKRFAIDF